MGRLKAFVDLYLTLTRISREIDWEAFVQRRKREGIQTVSLAVLALFLGLFNCRDKFREMASVVAREEKLLNLVSARNHQRLMETSLGRCGTRFGLLNFTNAPEWRCLFGGLSHFHFD